MEYQTAWRKLLNEHEELKAKYGKLKQEIIQMKTQMFPNEYEQDSLDAMDEGKALKGKKDAETDNQRTMDAVE